MTTAAYDRDTAFALLLPYFPPEIELLILDPDISDLMFTDGRVFVDRAGVMTEVDSAGLTARALESAIESIARQLGDDIGPEAPILDSRLPDGSRVAAVFPPCSLGWPTLTIRKFCRYFSLGELVSQGCVEPTAAQFICDALGSKKNLLISGGTGSGKTTLLNAIAGEIPAGERLIVIEKPAELKIRHRNAVRWEAVDELPGRKAVTVSQLVTAALRHRPDRIIVGEVRDQSAHDLLQAMNTGHGGTLSTIHANNALDALYRLSGRALAAMANLNQEFVRQETAAAIHAVIHIERHTDGARKVVQVFRVTGYRDGRFEGMDVFRRAS